MKKLRVQLCKSCISNLMQLNPYGVALEDLDIAEVPEEVCDNVTRAEARKINKYIFTFGCGRENAGCCLPVYAPTMEHARAKMVDLYGTAWAFSYTEEHWEECKARAAEQGWPIEKELPAIYYRRDV